MVERILNPIGLVSTWCERGLLTCVCNPTPADKTCSLDLVYRNLSFDEVSCADLFIFPHRFEFLPGCQQFDLPQPGSPQCLLDVWGRPY